MGYQPHAHEMRLDDCHSRQSFQEDAAATTAADAAGAAYALIVVDWVYSPSLMLLAAPAHMLTMCSLHDQVKRPASSPFPSTHATLVSDASLEWFHISAISAELELCYCFHIN